MTVLIQSLCSPVHGCLPYQRVKTVSTRHPRSINLSVVVSTVSVSNSLPFPAKILPPQWHGNKQGFAISHTAINHDKWWVKTERSTKYFAYQSTTTKTKSILRTGFSPRSVASLWSLDPLGRVICLSLSGDPFTAERWRNALICPPNNIACLQCVSPFHLPKYIIDFQHFMLQLPPQSRLGQIHISAASPLKYKGRVIGTSNKLFWVFLGGVICSWPSLGSLLLTYTSLMHGPWLQHAYNLATEKSPTAAEVVFYLNTESKIATDIPQETELGPMSNKN